MNTIITLFTSTIGGESQQTVNARDLHTFLEVGKDFSNWIKDRIAKFGFVESIDFVKIDSPNLANQKGGDRRSIEYNISLSMAKELSMIERNAKGKQARLYFIECERVAKSKTFAELPDFTNPVIAARAFADQYEKRMELEKQAQLAAPKLAFVEDFLTSDGDFLIRQAAKSLGIGVTKLFDWMRQKRLITKTNEPYADFCSNGILRPRFHSYTDQNSGWKTSLYTHITSRGLFYIYNRLIREGLLPQNAQINFDYLTTQES